MQRAVLALILSTALVAIGFVVTRDQSPEQTETPVAAEAASSTSMDRAEAAEEATSTTATARTRPSTTAPARTEVEATPTTVETTPTTAATSTTVAPATTTTKPPAPAGPPVIAGGPAIPATVTYPGDLKATGGYSITASNADSGVVWWTADYLGTNLPYTPGSKWVAGDREGYRCGYGFVMDASGDIAGRFAFVRPPDQAYAKVNDKYMNEAERYLDGTPTPYFGGTEKEIPEEDCTNVLSSIDYDGACRPVDERPRVGFFDGQGNVLDIRDYTHTDATSVNFNLHSFSGSRATVIACEDGLVGMIVYYDAMGKGQLAVDFKGAGPYK
jgi:hypothetical protein